MYDENSVEFCPLSRAVTLAFSLGQLALKLGSSSSPVEPIRAHPIRVHQEPSGNQAQAFRGDSETSSPY